MCLAVPMLIEEINDRQMGVVSIAGMKREVNLMLLDDPSPGDYVLIHAGFAIEKLDEDEAQQRLEILRAIAQFDIEEHSEVE